MLLHLIIYYRYVHTAVCNGGVRTNENKQPRKIPPSKTLSKQQEQSKQQQRSQKQPARPPPPKISYDTGSLPRRPKQGEGRGGIKRALSFYQENKRQAQLVRERREQGKDPIAATSLLPHEVLVSATSLLILSLHSTFFLQVTVHSSSEELVMVVVVVRNHQ